MKGVNINGENLNNLRFADDTALVAETEQDIQNMIDRLCKVCKDYGMSLNAKKTKVMIISKDENNNIGNIKAEGTDLEMVKDYKYLGTWVTSDGRCIEEVKRRIGKAKNEFWSCKEFLRSDINLQLKKKLLDTYIFSVISYGSETWTYNKDIKSRIEAFEMWCYRRLLKISWKYKITNKCVLERMGMKNCTLLRRLATRKVKFAGHVMRGSSGKVTSLILEGLIEGKRDRGRQRRTWSDDLKEWLNINRFVDIKRKAEERSVWRVCAANLRIGEGTA